SARIEGEHERRVIVVRIACTEAEPLVAVLADELPSVEGSAVISVVRFDDGYLCNRYVRHDSLSRRYLGKPIHRRPIPVIGVLDHLVGVDVAANTDHEDIPVDTV